MSVTTAKQCAGATATISAANRSRSAGAMRTEYEPASIVRTSSFAASAITLPGDFARPGAPVGQARESEQKVGETIQIDDGEGGQLHLMLQADDMPLRTAAHGARDVQCGGLGRAAGNDEGAQRLELTLAVVDGALELGDASFVDARLFEMQRHFVAVGGGEERPDREQVALYGNEHLVDARHHLDAARHSDDGVELVDVTVGFDADVVLGNAPPAEQSGVAGVAGLCVDLHGGGI